MEATLLRTAMITAVAPVAWGSTYIVTEQLLPPDRPLFAATVRALPAGLALLAYRRRLPTGNWWWKALMLGVCNIGLFFPLIFLAAYHLPGGLAATIQAASPLAVMALAWGMINERPGPLRIAAALIGLLGVGLLVLRSPAEVDLLGLVGAFGSVAVSALGFVLVKRWNTAEVDMLTLVSWQLVVGGVALVPVGLLVEGGPPPIDLDAAAGFGWLAVMGTTVAYVCWFHGLTRMPAGAVSLIGLLNPVVGTTLGVVIAGELFGWAQALGMALVLGGVLAGQLTVRSVRPSADRDPDLVGGLAVVGVDHPEPVDARLTGLDVGRERLIAHRDRHGEVLPAAALEALNLEDRALAAGIDPREVDAVHRPDRCLAC